MKSFNRDNKSGKGSSSRFHDSPSKKFNRGDSPKFRGRDSDRFERREPERTFEREMHTVICTKCGKRCEVPFRPTEGKPVYCIDCFRKSNNYESKRPDSSKSDFDRINEKLDKIIEALEID